MYVTIMVSHMKNWRREISADEIRSIRRSLGLSQAEAGDLLGGGPRAFTKYEAGTTKPSSSVVSLLRLLQADPGALHILRGDAMPRVPARTSPFDVSGKHISALSSESLVDLLRKMLHAEAAANGIPAESIGVSSNISAPDGGEDGRIAWKGGPQRTQYLPARINQFQLKAGKMTPSKAAADVITGTGAVKQMVQNVLEKNGVYLMLCAQRYTQVLADARRERIIEAIRNAGLDIRNDQVHFYDADKIAAWATFHPGVAAWVLERTQPGLGAFRSLGHWAGRREHNESPWIEDDRLIVLRERLVKTVQTRQGVLHVVGLAGIGKSRLTLEALRRVDDGVDLTDLVIYAVESEVGSVEIVRYVQNCADSGMRAIVVVDGCLAKTRRTLARTVSHAVSGLSLITIEDEIPDGSLGHETIKVPVAPICVNEGIVDRALSSRHSEDRRRLIQFSKGFPTIAFSICNSWNDERGIARATEKDLVDEFVLGRASRHAETTLRAAMLLSTFGLIQYDYSTDDEIREVASLGDRISESELRFGIDDLLSRQIVRKHGRDVAVRPRPIALNLAERQWRKWSKATWDRVLVGETNAELKVKAARQLAMLNSSGGVAGQVVQHVCRPEGGLRGRQGIEQASHAELLPILAEINAESVLNVIDSALVEVAPNDLHDDIRREIVWALEKAAFSSGTFERGAGNLLHLAVRESEPWANNATGQFESLFPVYLGNTAADGTARLRFVDKALQTSDAGELGVVAETLLKAADTRHFSRYVGSETHGARAALNPWQPENEEARNYVRRCVERLIKIGQRDDAVGERVRKGLVRRVRSLVCFGLIDTVENVVRQIGSREEQPSEAMKRLGHCISFDAERIGSKTTDRVKALLWELKPSDLRVRARMIVTDMPWDYPCDERLKLDERDQRQREAIQELAIELIAKPDVLLSLLPGFSSGYQRKSYQFGMAIVQLSKSPLVWLDSIKCAVMEAAEPSYDLLLGCLVAIERTSPNAVTAFKEQAAVSSSLAPMLPELCLKLNRITKKDIRQVIAGLRSGLIRPERLMHWTIGGVLAKNPPSVVAPLFETTISLSAEAYAIGLDILDAYTHGDRTRLDKLRPQVLMAMEKMEDWPVSSLDGSAGRAFERIARWMLEKGRDDADSCHVALQLARRLTADIGHKTETLIQPSLPTLLARFPEIVWPLFGQAILSDPQTAWRFQFMLGDQSEHEIVTNIDRKERPVILCLPEESLFAWCHANPDTAPAFVAAVVPFLDDADSDVDRKIHPISLRLIEEFGDRENVLKGLKRSIYSFSWIGSLTTYFIRFLEPVQGLLGHPRAQVRSWARRTLHQLRTDMEACRNDDEEQAALWNL